MHVRTYKGKSLAQEFQLKMTSQSFETTLRWTSWWLTFACFLNQRWLNCWFKKQTNAHCMHSLLLCVRFPCSLQLLQSVNHLFCKQLSQITAAINDISYRFIKSKFSVSFFSTVLHELLIVVGLPSGGHTASHQPLFWASVCFWNRNRTDA